MKRSFVAIWSPVACVSIVFQYVDIGGLFFGITQYAFCQDEYEFDLSEIEEEIINSVPVPGGDPTQSYERMDNKESSNKSVPTEG